VADTERAERARYLIDQAKDDSRRYLHNSVGYNYRLTNLQAAMGVAQLEALPAFLEAKKRNHARYATAVDGVPGLRLLGAPEGTAPNDWFYSLLVEPTVFGKDREELMMTLDRAGIQTRPLWYPNHLQAPYRNAQTFGVERAVWFWERVLNLPCSGDLSDSELDRVVSAVIAAAEQQ
jgi:dTDP-4-amino-4,6-dideoxygalactose transaminase